MTKRTIILEDIWCDESDEFWNNEEEIEETILKLFSAINWEIGKVKIITEALPEK
ncbi:hypothetical protein KA005_68070 [bacterium]|nr:hypothetical protein [bacterium]